MSQTYWWQITDNTTGGWATTGTSTSPVARTETHIVREVVHREVDFQLDESGDGRTLFTRIVPYNTPVEVSDPPFFEPYVEEWKPGVFDKQLRAANRVDVLLNFEHEKGIGGVVGRGTELKSQEDGLHGTFRLLAGGDGEKARELVHEKVLTGMSLEAVVIKSLKQNGVVSRVEARLKNVAICRNPAFPGAEVLAVRTEDDPAEPDPDPVEGEPNPAEPQPQPEPQIVVPELAVRDNVTELLEKVGVPKLDRFTVVRGHWEGSPARFQDDEYERSCLLDRGGDGPAKERCSLPILEPTGELNVTAMGIATRLLPTTTGITNAQRSEAARRLVRLHRLAGLDAPQALLDAARR
jgi:HK97 family phage prohead protease